MKNEIEQQIFEKMKAKDFGESMCNETKRNVLRWVMQQLRIHDVVGRSEQLTCPRCNSTNILSPDKDNDAQCIECAFIWAG